MTMIWLSSVDIVARSGIVSASSMLMQCRLLVFPRTRSIGCAAMIRRADIPVVRPPFSKKERNILMMIAIVVGIALAGYVIEFLEGKDVLITREWRNYETY